MPRKSLPRRDWAPGCGGLFGPDGPRTGQALGPPALSPCRSSLPYGSPHREPAELQVRAHLGASWSPDEEGGRTAGLVCTRLPGRGQPCPRPDPRWPTLRNDHPQNGCQAVGAAFGVHPGSEGCGGRKPPRQAQVPTISLGVDIPGP